MNQGRTKDEPKNSRIVNVLFIKIIPFPKKVDLIPEKVVSLPKKVDLYPKTIDYFPKKFYSIPKKIYSLLRISCSSFIVFHP